MAFVVGTNLADTINQSDGVTNSADQIYGFGGSDLIFGLNGNDDIFGGSGNDTLTGGAGADHLDGGTGTDTAAYSDSAQRVIVNLVSGTGFGGTAEGDTLVGIDNISGSQFNDILTGYDLQTGNDGINVLSGLQGNDVVKGGGGNDTLNGDSGDDTLKGGGGADILNGGMGIDTVGYQESPAGVLVSLATDIAGLGDAQGDELNGIENVIGSAFADTLVGDDFANVLNGMAGNDVLKGFNGADTLLGGDGHDSIDGGIGADTMIGGLGDDSYIVDNAGDAVTELGGEGIDFVSTSVSWVMTAGADIETLQAVDDTGTFPLTLIGNDNGNEIIGNNGHNLISGGGGVDQMVGRGGNDGYRVDNAGDAVTEAGGQGQDQVFTSVNWTLTAGADVETLRTDNDAGVGAINLTGNETGNRVVGNDGTNVLNGGDGNDELVGLLGQDSFLFDTPLSAAFNIDVIADFNVADDTILLDDDVFSSSLGLGNIAVSEFVIGAAALDANDRIIYNDVTGALFYDSDGNGATAQVQFARLSAGLALTSVDFFVVA